MVPPTTDPIVARFLELQDVHARNLLLEVAQISRDGSTIILVFRTQLWRAFVQKQFYPLKTGEDLQLSVVDCVVRQSAPIQEPQKRGRESLRGNL